MRFAKKLVMYLLCVTCLSATISVFGNESSQYADALNVLGVMRGTENGYELERVPTRSEVLVMIIRLLGKEQEALEFTYANSFTDTLWDEPYVSYGYYHSIVKGISENSFGGDNDSTLMQYCTMLLRVLGYDDTKGDFIYENSVSFASLTLGEEIHENTVLSRGKMAKLACFALSTRQKGSIMTLGQSLVQQCIISQLQLSDSQRCYEQQEAYTSTTVLIYAIGSDLESQQNRLSNDLKEILLASPKDNCQVLLQSGGTKQYHNEWMNDGKAERFSAYGNELKLVESDITTKAYEGQTLKDFITWGVQKAPSQRYILVLWDHGYGIKGGFGSDELSQNKTMCVSELSGAITASNVFFDVIAFDACLMGTAETAFALRNTAKYLIASEESTPACGLYYTTWLGALERNPSISTERLGRLILDSFNLHAGIEANIPTTISMMKLSRAQILFDYMALYSKDLIESAKACELLGKNDGIYDQFDLLSVIKDIPEITAATGALASEVRNSFDDGKYCGVGLYVPVYKSEDFLYMIDELKKIGLNNAYLYQFQIKKEETE